MGRDPWKLDVFTHAHALVLRVYPLTLRLPLEERYGLQSQIRRAAVSTPTNIVEGSVRHSDKHYLRYLENALGSACEVRYLMGLCIRLKILGKRESGVLIERYTAVVKGLSA